MRCPLCREDHTPEQSATGVSIMTCPRMPENQWLLTYPAGGALATFSPELMPRTRELLAGEEREMERMRTSMAALAMQPATSDPTASA